MAEPVAVGIVGAGPWAGMVHAPMLAAGPETRLAGVWARRPEAAAQLAAKHGSTPFEDFDAFLDACEAVAFCVPPGVQPELAARAARKGKALLLEKPIADSLAAAEQLGAIVAERGVTAQLMLSYRYAAHVRSFLEQSRTFEAWGARGGFISGGFLEGSPFAFGWRLTRGALLDVGPHGIDLAWAALGSIIDIQAAGDLQKLVALTLRHESGALSQLQFSAKVALPTANVGLELFGPAGSISIDAMANDWPAVFATIRSEFAAVVRSGKSHELDLARGVELQRIIELAERQLGR